MAALIQENNHLTIRTRPCHRGALLAIIWLRLLPEACVAALAYQQKVTFQSPPPQTSAALSRPPLRPLSLGVESQPLKSSASRSNGVSVCRGQCLAPAHNAVCAWFSAQRNSSFAG